MFLFSFFFKICVGCTGKATSNDIISSDEIFHRPFPISLLFIKKLEILQLSHLNMSKISPLLGSFRFHSASINNGMGGFHLRILNLSHNLIDEIPIEMCRLKKLEILNLSYNNIIELPAQVLIYIHCYHHIKKIKIKIKLVFF